MLALYISAALTALPLGAMYALQATGIVLVYRTTRVFNFAQAGIGVVAAYTAAEIGKQTGGGHLGALLGGLVGVAVGAALGILIEVSSVRWTKGSLQRTVVTLGWLLALQSLVIAIFTPTTTLTPAAIFSDGHLFAFPYAHNSYSWQDVSTLAIAATAAVAIAIFLGRSAFGVSMRAVADDPEAGALLGLPVSRVLLVTWGLGGAVAGLAGVLITPLLGTLDTYSLFLVTVQAIAAALVARLASLPLAFAGGLGVAVLQLLAKTRFPTEANIGSLVAFVVVVAAVLLVRRTGRVDVSAGGLAPVRVRPLPSPRLGVPLLAAGGAVVFVLPFFFGEIGDGNLSQIGAWSIAALSVVLLTGVAGQVSVCQCVFMGVGATVAAAAYARTGLPFVVCLLLGAVAAAAAAFLVGIPALRLEPIELAIVTVAFGFAADGFLFQWNPFVAGNRNLERPSYFAESTTHGERSYAWLVLGAFLLLAVGVGLLRRGRTGAALTALRSSAPATSAMGFSVTSAKLVGFAAAGAIAGLGGALFSAVSGTVSVGGETSTLSTTASITLIAYALIAGVGNVPAALLGGFLVVYPTISGHGATNPHVFGLINLAAGLLLVGVVVLLPQGLASLIERIPRPAFVARAEA